MNIVKLTSENVKRLTAVEITPKGNVVVIGGRNGQGKSSVLDSIWWGLGGKPDVKMPVRRGEEKSKTTIDLGELIVKRNFTATGGTTLVVTNADGAPQRAPQDILNALTGKLTFDPLEFARQKPDFQAVTLRKLVNLDFTETDKKHKALYDQRTEINRDALKLKAQFDALPKHEGLPTEEVSAESILLEQENASKKNDTNRELREAYQSALDNLEEFEDATFPAAEEEIKGVEEEIKSLEKQLENNRKLVKDLTAKKDILAGQLPGLKNQVAVAKIAADLAKDEDLTKFRAKLQEVEQTNAKIRQRNQRAELVRSFKEKSEAAEKLTSEMEKIESAKRKATTEAKYPVDGLLFDTAGGITLNGIPFEQCSSAEQLKVSLSIAFALNPKLKIVLIRDGSLLDDDSMVVLSEMAEAAKAQVWMERVGTDAHTSVVIEDGHVQEGELL